MKPTLFLLPLMLCLLAPAPALAEDEPAPDTRAAVADALAKKISLHLDRASFAEAVAPIAEATGLRIVVPEDAEGTVILDLRDVTAEAALHAIAKMGGWKLHLTKGGAIELRRPAAKVKRIRHEGDPLRIAGKLVVGGPEQELMLVDVDDLDDDVVGHLQRASPDLLIERRGATLVLRGSKATLAPALKTLDALRADRHAAGAAKPDDDRALRRKRIKEEKRRLKVDLDDLQRRMTELKQEQSAAKERGDGEAAAAYARALDELAAKRKALMAEHKDLYKGARAGVPQPPKAPRPPEAAKDAHRAALEKLRDAELARKRAQEHADRIRRAEPAMPLFGRAGHRDEHAERLEHLRNAHRSLSAAGLREQAAQVGREIRELEQHLHARRADASGGGVLQELRALREEVHGLRAEVQMLTAMVKKLLPEREPRRAR